MKTENPHQPTARPFVFINMAMTADGKIATSNRAVSTFGSARDHEHLLELRARADAVMSGARTVDSATINLGPGGGKFCKLRLKRGLAEYNLRIVVSGSGSIKLDAEIFKHHFSPIIILTTERMPSVTAKRLESLGGIVKKCGATEIDFTSALLWLRRKWKVKRLLCEGGGALNEALFRAGLVDELHLTVCPKIFGGRTAPTIVEGLGFHELAAAAQMELRRMRRVGSEIFLTYAIQPAR